jgi:hypothetical protein
MSKNEDANVSPFLLGAVIMCVAVLMLARSLSSRRVIGRCINHFGES